MLSNLDKRLCQPEVIEEALRDHRGMWVNLYRAGLGNRQGFLLNRSGIKRVGR